MVGRRKEEIDVFHGSKAWLGVVGGHGRPFQYDGLETGVGQRTDRECDRLREQQQRLHFVNVGISLQGSAQRAELVETITRLERPPQQRSDPMFLGGGHGPGEVCPLFEAASQRFGMGIAPTRLPKQGRCRHGGDAVPEADIADAVILPCANAVASDRRRSPGYKETEQVALRWAVLTEKGL